MGQIPLTTRSQQLMRLYGDNYEEIVSNKPMYRANPWGNSVAYSDALTSLSKPRLYATDQARQLASGITNGFKNSIVPQTMVTNNQTSEDNHLSGLSGEIRFATGSLNHYNLTGGTQKMEENISPDGDVDMT